MKNAVYLLMFISFLISNLSQGQEQKESGFSLVGYGGIGYGIVENDRQPNYNLNSNHGEFLLNYSINKGLGLATGVGINELTGNGFNEQGNFYHERAFLRVPLLITLGSEVSESLRIIANLGFYGQNIIKDQYSFQNASQTDVYDGWNIGAQFGLGFMFRMLDKVSAGINYHGQSDFSKLESANNTGIRDKQRIQNLNSVGIIFMFSL